MFFLDFYYSPSTTNDRGSSGSATLAWSDKLSEELELRDIRAVLVTAVFLARFLEAC